MDRYCFVLDECDDRMKYLKAELKQCHNEAGTKCYVFSPNVLMTQESVRGLEDGSVLIFGRIADDAIPLIETKALRAYCLLKDEEFAARNAILTAEAALAILIDRSKLALSELNVLIVGFGRIGAALANYLCRLGVRTTIATSASSRPARAFSDKVISTQNIDFSPYDVVVNTAPAIIATDQQVLSLKENSIFIELASNPSINLNFARYVGVDADIYPALPTKYSPISAARIIMDFIKEKLEKT